MDTSMIRDVTDALRRAEISFDVLGGDSSEVSAAMGWLEQAFSIEPWGRVAWSRVEQADCRPYATWGDMIRIFGELLDRVHPGQSPPDAPILVVWSNAARPGLRVPFAALRACGAEILDEDFDVWILCPAQGWCIENYHDGELCFGRVAASRLVC
jgi:hypothetical protein